MTTETTEEVKEPCPEPCPYRHVSRGYCEELDEVFEGSICTFADKHCLLDGGQECEIYEAFLKELERENNVLG